MLLFTVKRSRKFTRLGQLSCVKNPCIAPNDFEVAASTEGVGDLVEILKWNVPAYLREKPKNGTTLRLQGVWMGDNMGLYVPCATGLIEQCKGFIRVFSNIQKIEVYCLAKEITSQKQNYVTLLPWH